jgi:protein arginine N-methyltransferase 3
MGYALLYESMLPSVLHARDIYLKKSPSAGIMAPSQCRMFLTMVQVPDIMRERLDFWDDVYGFKMGVFKEDVLKDSIVEVVKDENVVTDASMVKVTALLFSCRRELIGW